ncbi:ER membrane protein complex subunit 1-like [Dendronephthya gigantea]|uniref:ER membrane protein complex subunit 1-like n=1 Tax=Dendronephthya gigantea TaxID=151771 RepID=UPI001068E58C|nr:ER membrane protein complex subunit 1-like [Dendronephthya gigantea]
MAVVYLQFLRLILLYLFLSILLFSLTYCLYEDQIGFFDWRKRFVGKLNYVNFDGSAANNKRIIVSSEENVLAALNSRTGNLIWRRVLERSNNTIDKLLYFSETLISLSGHGKFLRSWDPANGNIIWENTFGVDESLMKKPLARGLKSVDAIVSDEHTQNVFAMAGNNVKAYSIASGKEIWVKEETLDRYLFGLMFNDDSLFTLGSQNDEIFMQKLNIETGKEENVHTVVVPWLFHKETSCIFISNVLMCADPVEKILHTLQLQSEGISVQSTQISSLSSKVLKNVEKLTLYLPHSLSITQSRRECVLQLSEKHSMLLKLNEDNSIVLLQEYNEEMLFHTSSFGAEVLLMTATLSTSGMELKCYNGDTMSEIEDMVQTLSFPSHHGKPVNIFTHFFLRKDNSIGYRVLTIFEDYSVSLSQHTGRIFWTREESLASITAVEMIELPVSPQQANFEALQREFGYHHDGKVFSMFSQRIQAQFQQFQAFLASLNIEREENLGESDDQKNGEDLTRDQFDLRKIIVVVTASGKLFGLDTIDGSIIWQQFIPDMAPFVTNGKSLLYMQRSVAHFPLVPQCVVVGRSQSGQGSVMFTFNPSTGQSIDPRTPHGERLPYNIHQTMLLPYHDDKFSKLLLVVDTSLNAHVYPNNKRALSIINAKSKSIFIHIADKMELKGYVVNAEQMALEEVWKIPLSPSEHIIDQIVFKRLGEHVHSPGRVLGDRRVLYKYLNPNLMAVVTRSPSISKPTVHIFLIDSVTGNIIHHGRHRNAQGPLHVVHSENWIIYKYYNTKARRHELAVLELYEGYQERNSTAFSSLDPPVSPMVLQQSYIFPFNVDSMTTTITNAGITKKTLLVGVSLGYIYSLPKMFLDPRRNLTDSPRLREEGLMPYIPELPLMTTSFINYNQTVSNIEGIYTSPAGLESTCLVFTYGLDLYFTRVTPSRLFDVLKEDFDYWFISATLILLAIVTLVSARFASVKVLRQMWR